MNNYNYFNNTFLNTDNNLYGSYEGYLKGNLFRNLYEPYKNYKVANVNIRNEKDELLFNLDQTQFAMHELNLLLDVNPNNKEALNLFNSYKNTYDNLLEDYQSKYGPINVTGSNNSTPFDWVSGKFPWEVM